ncbi:MAG: serine hydrolase domain-containing protein [Chlamydiales bacterium]|nr:serine hydrolase domain-containing protein [Chlamydiales bacterium]
MDVNITPLHLGTAESTKEGSGKAIEVVQINGHSFSVAFPEEQGARVREAITEVMQQAPTSEAEFKNNLATILDNKSSKGSDSPRLADIQSIAKASKLYISNNDEKPQVGKWFKEESKALPKERRAVASALWDKGGDLSPFLGCLKRNLTPVEVQQFEAVIEKKGTADGEEVLKLKNEFIGLFDNLSRSQVDSIEANEGLNLLEVFPMRKLVENIKLSEDVKEQLSDYMRDVSYSGVVSISTPSEEITVSTAQIPDPQAPFSIHSVGKVFTGVLMMKMIKNEIVDEKILDKPVQLEDHVKEIIADKSPVLAKHLEKTSLRELMLHQSGLGDYLGNYQDAIESALESNTPIPEVKRPEEFLQFANDDIEALDLSAGEQRYSNLGILLVGLAIQSHYNEKNKDVEGYQHKSFDEILKKEVFDSAGIKVSLNKPENAIYNEKTDPVAAHLCATPGGGHWTSAEDLQKFGKWLCQEVHQEDMEAPNSLYQILERNGGEFYGGGVIGHAGAINSASSQLTVLLKPGITIAALANREKIGSEFAAVKLNQAIDRNILTELE